MIRREIRVRLIEDERVLLLVHCKEIFMKNLLMSKPEPAVLSVADLTLDLVGCRVTRGRQVVDLTPTEFAILTVLMRHAGRVVTRTRLAESVWQGATSFAVIHVHIGHLRKKLDRAGAGAAAIRTVRGAGYRIGPQGGGASRPLSRGRSSSSSRQVGFDTTEG